MSAQRCTGVEFISESTVKNEETPDLKACDKSGLVICEFKTINISDIEADPRQKGGVFTTKIHVVPCLRTKIESTIEKAEGQIRTYLKESPARKIILMVINFDDGLHEYADVYGKQTREFLDERQLVGIEVQFDISPPFYTAMVS